MSVILNTHPLFFVSAIKNRLSVAKESARLVDSAVFSEYWIHCMQPGIQAKTLQKQKEVNRHSNNN